MLDTIKADQSIEFSLGQLREAIERRLHGEAMFIYGPIIQGLDDAIRDDIEETLKKHKKAQKNRLIVVIETPGGFVEIAERISNVFRHHFEIVDFIVPNHAYSAGTVLVLSGDSIHMDYYSILGPIDPQHVKDGRLIPLMGYLYEYDKLVDKSRKGTLTEAELFLWAKRFDPAEMSFIKEARDYSKELITKWLVQYKFKNWDRTKTRGRKVTPQMKQRRAGNIARVLGNAQRWHFHGRGITMQELQSEEIRLMIDDYGQDKNLSGAIHQYYDLLKDYCRKMDVNLALHSINGFRRLG